MGQFFGTGLFAFRAPATNRLGEHFEDCQRLTRQRRNIADALVMPGVADTAFDPPRACLARAGALVTRPRRQAAGPGSVRPTIQTDIQDLEAGFSGPAFLLMPI
ncbi:hypothetical protein [Melaminivora sp.]|uniref:hypothetical protein n=1 Tax=Melaminivora sp. TaxID=1933032 RepID=UPI003917D8FD